MITCNLGSLDKFGSLLHRSIDNDKKISRILKDYLCEDKTKTTVDTDEVLKNYETLLRPRNGKVMYKD